MDYCKQQPGLAIWEESAAFFVDFQRAEGSGFRSSPRLYAQEEGIAEIRFKYRESPEGCLECSVASDHLQGESQKNPFSRCGD